MKGGTETVQLISIVKNSWAGVGNWKQDIKSTSLRKCHFTKSEWETFSEPEEGVSLCYLLWRGIFMTLFLYIVVNSLAPHDLRGNNFYGIYLTNWSLWTQLIYSALFFTHSVISFSCKKPRRQNRNEPKGGAGKAEVGAESQRIEHAMNQLETDETLPNKTDQLNQLKIDAVTVIALEGGKLKTFHLKTTLCLEPVIWILFNVVGTLPIFVTLGYWLTVYSPKVDGKLLYVRNYNTVMVHGVTAVLSLVDSMVVALPVRLTHFLYLLGILLTYLVFSLIYEIGVSVYPDPQKPYIYSVLNWRQNPGWTALACLVTLVVFAALHLILWLRYIFRLFLISSCSCRTDREYVYEYHCYLNSSSKNSNNGAVEEAEKALQTVEELEDLNPDFAEIEVQVDTDMDKNRKEATGDTIEIEKVSENVVGRESLAMVEKEKSKQKPNSTIVQLPTKVTHVKKESKS